MLKINIFNSLKWSKFALCLSKILNINLHDINYCFNIVLPLFIHTNLVNININIGIFLFLNVALSKFGLRTQYINSNKYGT